MRPVCTDSSSKTNYEHSNHVHLLKKRAYQQTKPSSGFLVALKNNLKSPMDKYRSKMSSQHSLAMKNTHSDTMSDKC